MNDSGDTHQEHRCSVLVVEDDPDLREVLLLTLGGQGYHVSWASNGRDALHYLRSQADTCIIVLDLMLPVMDGAKFREVQLRDRALAWIPVVIISGADEAAAQARALGARSFVKKPLDIDRVKEAVGRIGCCQARPR